MANRKIVEAGASTRFPKGWKGGGRKPVPEDVKEVARALTIEAIETLGEVMRNKSAPPAARVSASTAILDRVYGKPAQTVEATVTRGVVDMTDEELVAFVRAGDDEP